MKIGSHFEGQKRNKVNCLLLTIQYSKQVFENKVVVFDKNKIVWWWRFSDSDFEELYHHNNTTLQLNFLELQGGVR